MSASLYYTMLVRSQGPHLRLPPGATSLDTGRFSLGMRPEGAAVEVAPLETIGFSRLRPRASDVNKFLIVCQTHDFFYLDLQTNDTGRHILADEQNVLKVMEGYFGQSLETKMKDDRNSVLHGYKPVGVFSRVTENSKDCYETLKVSPIEMVEKSTNLPRLFDSYISLSQHITQTMLSACASRLEYKHRSSEPSNTTLFLLSYPPNIDNHNMWGLQVVTPEVKYWTYVQPRPGHAIINVGDSLRFLSGKRLMSCLHHVMPFKPTEHRYSIACFLGPESAVELKDTEDSKVTAEWFDNKYVMFAEPHGVQAESPTLTGGVEQMLVTAGV
ncbi:hypothetical protein JB92DRAFT_3091255 [Gautieria morchelliformis]|nr:hypothetical protein JB92DRAFT_3091255 [Gautieria morchelliformis]